MSPIPSEINIVPTFGTAINKMPIDSYVIPSSPTIVQATNLLVSYSYKYIKYSKPSVFA